MKRHKVDVGEKRHRIRVYRQGDGLLFVPSVSLWEVHYAAAKCRFPDGKEWSIRSLRAEVEGHLDRRIPDWLFGNNPLREYHWFFPWLLRGKRTPAKVKVVAPKIIAAVRKWWDYPALCRQAGVTRLTYVRWLRRWMLPTVEWLKWLYLNRVPDGCFVVSQALLKLREEMSEKRILAKAGVSRRTLRRGDPQTEAALAAAISAARMCGKPGGLVKVAAWNQQPEVVQAAMWRYAKAATITAASERAGIHQPMYPEAMAQAKRLGVQEHLEAYIATRGRRKSHRQCGLVAPNFFIPSAGMLAVQRAALDELAKHHVKDLAACVDFDEWFIDCVTPRARHGRRDAPAFSSSRAARSLVCGSTDADNGHAVEQADGAKNKRGKPMRNRGRPAGSETRTSDLYLWDDYQAAHNLTGMSKPAFIRERRLDADEGLAALDWGRKAFKKSRE